VSGSGAPYPLGAKEDEEWGQKKDVPEQGMAIFPPDKPMGWPAASYERATITYIDEQGRTVNTANPSGGISTTEYNETNEPVRTLSPDNRATAIAEGGGSAEKSAAIADKLDSESTYNEKGQLTETLGPEHKVRLAKGKEKAGEEVQAREHIVYSYDEESPGGAVFNLVTKTVSDAETASKEEFDKRTTETSYSGQKGLGWILRKPTSVTVDSGGLNLTTTTTYEEATGNVIETTTPGRGNSALPQGFSQFGKAGSGAGQVNGPTAAAADPSGDLWVADTGNNRIDEFSATGTFIKAFGWGVDKGKEKLEVCTTECKAGIAGAEKGQLSEPQGVAYDAATEDLYVSDTGNNRIEEFTTAGKVSKVYGTKGSGELQFNSPHGLTTEPDGDIWIADQANHRLEEITDKGKYVKEAGVAKGEYSDVTLCASKLFATNYAGQQVEEVGTEGKETILKTFGTAGKENGQFTQISRIACDPKNDDLYITDQGGDRIEVFTDAGKYAGSLGSAGSGSGELNTPVGVTVNSSGTAYVADNANNRMTEWALNEGAHDTKAAYYTAEGESEVPECRSRPEWAGLVCQTEPAEQPGTANLPELPVTSFSYNLWDEVVATTEKFGAVTRTKAQTYDAAGRAETSHTTSTSKEDTALPEVTDEYNAKNGELEKQTSEGKTITSIYNTIGQLTSYTDADGNTTTHEYEPEGDARLTGTNDGKGTQTYTYNTTTGDLTKLVDSAAGAFTATYDVEGKILTEGYPNGMAATYTYNPDGTATGIEYVKSAHCATKCPEAWFSDRIVPSIHGETLAQTSTLSKESYVYDNIGRLIEAQETPTGKGCKTRLYAYDEESNRISLTTRESSTETCTTEGGVTEAHSYDSADRLSDPGVTYETFGNTTKLPEADAGGHELALTSSYYVDSQVATQTQDEETVNHYYDPDGRTRETVSTGKTSSTAIMHYSGPEEAVAWTNEGGEKWTRNIPGIDGALDATETNTGTTVLQIHDLKGNVVGTAEDNETKTELLSTYNSTEFGVPSEGKAPPRYAWFGANGVTTELSAGIASQGGSSYVPQIAKDLQTASVVPPGAFPDGAGSGSPYTATISAAEITSSEAEVKQYVEEIEAARQKAKVEEEEARGEEEFGDPMKCYVGGNAFEIGDKAVLNGYGGCNQGLPAGTWIYVCLGLESDGSPGKTNAGCSHQEVKGHTSRYHATGDSKVLHCDPYEIAVTLIEFYVPGGKVLYAASENAGECQGHSDEEDEAALSLFGTNDSLGAVQGVLEFFQAALE
jgi:YD repeat-containing protein